MWWFTLVLLLITSPVLAFNTATLLDNFNRADEAPLASNWSQPIFTTFTNTVNLVSNAIKRASGSGDGGAWWNVGTFGPDSRITVTMPTEGSGQRLDLWVRVTSPNAASATDGYRCLFFNTADIRIQRIDNSGGTQIAQSLSFDPASGDQLGCQADGTTISAWVKIGAGAWTQATSVTDATYNAAGFVGVSFTAGETIGDDVGACTLVGGECPSGLVLRRRGL